MSNNTLLFLLVPEIKSIPRGDLLGGHYMEDTRLDNPNPVLFPEKLLTLTRTLELRRVLKDAGFGTMTTSLNLSLLCQKLKVSGTF